MKKNYFLFYIFLLELADFIIFIQDIFHYQVLDKDKFKVKDILY